MWIARNDYFGQEAYVISFNKPARICEERKGKMGISFQEPQDPGTYTTYIRQDRWERFEEQERIHLKPGEGPYEFHMWDTVGESITKEKLEQEGREQRFQ